MGPIYVLTPGAVSRHSDTQAWEVHVAKGASGRTILVCEDDPLVAGFFQDVFKAAGHQVVSAHDGESAVQMATELKPAVVTLDIDLPGLDGGAVISRLKANPDTAHIPVIIISAHPGWLTFVERHQASAILEKPCPPWELQAAVEQALDENRET
jgi:CheY-like chemotaxis protein